MKRIASLSIAIISGICSSYSQEKYLDGYALKGNDTIYCKVQKGKNDVSMASVKLLIEGEEITFYPGGPVTGFGTTNEDYHFGALKAEVQVGNRNVSNFYYVRKLVTGRVELYEYSYFVTTTRRTTVNGVEQPGSTSNTQRNTKYFISKHDSNSGPAALPIPLPSFKSKDLEHYFSDQPDLFANAEKRFSTKELVAFIKEYNSKYK